MPGHKDALSSRRDVGAPASVIARESPTGAGQLQDDGWDQSEADEYVQRHERVHAEQDGYGLDDDRDDDEQTDRRCQAFFPAGFSRRFRSRVGSSRAGMI